MISPADKDTRAASVSAICIPNLSDVGTALTADPEMLALATRDHTDPGASKMTQQDHIDDFLTIANPNFWANLDGLTIDQAAALSAGIDPEGLSRLRDLQRSDQMDEEEPIINFGAKQDRYYQNKALIETAISVGALHLVNELLPYQEFHAWATTKGLSLPTTPPVAPQANDAIDVFLRDFLGANYQDYARLKLAILGAKQYATGQVKTQLEVVEYFTTVTGNGQAQSREAKEKIAYVAQSDSRGRPGRR